MYHRDKLGVKDKGEAHRECPHRYISNHEVQDRQLVLHHHHKPLQLVAHTTKTWIHDLQSLQLLELCRPRQGLIQLVLRIPTRDIRVLEVLLSRRGRLSHQYHRGASTLAGTHLPALPADSAIFLAGR